MGYGSPSAESDDEVGYGSPTWTVEQQQKVKRIGRRLSLPTVVNIAASPDDKRVIGAVNNNGTSNDTRRIRTTRKVRGKVANVWKPAPASITTTTGFCRCCE
jgi:hypothetical protein